MQKKWLWIGGGIVAALLVAALYVIFVPPNAPKSIAPENIAGNTKKACEIFTDDIAKKVLGKNAKKSESISSENQASTENIIVSNCGYEVGKTIANVLVRGAKQEEAYSTNIFGFDGTRNQAVDGKKARTVPIQNLGDQAFYNPDFQQVNILVNKGQYWVIVQVGEDKSVAERLARAVVEKL